MGVGLRSMREDGRYVPVYLFAGVVAILAYFQLPTDELKAFLYDGLVVSGAVAMVIGVRRNQPFHRVHILWYCCAASLALMAAGRRHLRRLRPRAQHRSGAGAVVGRLLLHRQLPVPADGALGHGAMAAAVEQDRHGARRDGDRPRRGDRCRRAAAGGQRRRQPLGRSPSSWPPIYPIADVALLAAASFLALQRGLRNPATPVAHRVAAHARRSATWPSPTSAPTATTSAPASTSRGWRTRCYSAPPRCTRAWATSRRGRGNRRRRSGVVRAGIIGLALAAAGARAHLGDGVRGRALARVAGAASRWWRSVLVRLMRLSAETQAAHDESNERARSLAMAREEIAHIVEGAADAIIGGDNEGRITAWNSGAEQLLGVSADKAIGTTIDTFVAEDITPWVEAFRNMMPGDIRSAVLPARRCRRHAPSSSTCASALATTPDGKIMGWVAIARDASEALVASTAASSGDLDPGDRARERPQRSSDASSTSPPSAWSRSTATSGTYREVLTVGDHVAIHLPDEGTLDDEALAVCATCRPCSAPATTRWRSRPSSSFLERARAHRGVGVTIRHATLGPIGLLLIALETRGGAAGVGDRDDPLARAVADPRRPLADAGRGGGDLGAARAGSRRACAHDFSEFVRNDMREQVAAIRSAVNVLSDTKIVARRQLARTADGEPERERRTASSNSSATSPPLGWSSTGGSRASCARSTTSGELIRGTVEQHQVHDRRNRSTSRSATCRPVKGDAERLGAGDRPPADQRRQVLAGDRTDRRVGELRGAEPPHPHRRARPRHRHRARRPRAGVPSLLALGARRRARDPKAPGLGLFIAQGIVESHGGRISVTSQLGEGRCSTSNCPPSSLRLWGLPGSLGASPRHRRSRPRRGAVSAASAPGTAPRSTACAASPCSPCSCSTAARRTTSTASIPAASTASTSSSSCRAT